MSEDYTIRTYSEGDEGKLVEFFNKAYREYVGFTPRTTDFWLWCCKRRPGVRNEGIIIVKTEHRILAYAVVSDSGNVLELCYDSCEDEKQIVTKLLEAVQDYVKETRADAITLNAAKEDPIVREVCKKLGFAESHLPYAFQISILDPTAYVKQTIACKREEIQFRGNVLLKLGQPITLTITDEKMDITKEKNEKPDITIEADKQTITSTIFGNLNPYIAVVTWKIRVSPFWKVRQACRLLSLLKLDAPIYTPLGDFG